MLNTNLAIILQAAAGGQSSYSFLIMMGLIVVIFYFFMIRPQVKRQKEEKKFRESLAVGDKIVTLGGIFGKIAEIQETAVIIEVEGKMRLKVAKNALVKDTTAIMGQTNN